jgi:serine/threonine-protein kinase RsbW
MNSDMGVLIRPVTRDFPFEETTDSSENLFRLSLPAHLSYIGVARRAIEALGEQYGLSDDDRNSLKLAVGEACNNAVQYGNLPHAFQERPKDNRNILVVCRVLPTHDVPEFVEVDIITQGTDFHPSQGEFTMPTAESLAEHGRGLALIKLIMDSVDFLTEDGHQIVRMRKRIANHSFVREPAITEISREP